MLLLKPVILYPSKPRLLNMTSFPPPAEIVSTFRNSGLHGIQFQNIRHAYAVVKYKDRRGKTHVHKERNTWVSHAEREMIQYLENKLESEALTSQTIKFYVNFSPCFQCSGHIVSFLEEAEQLYDIDLKLEIIFSHLYKIRRPSCLDGSHNKDHRLPEPAEHKRNLVGLRKLSSVYGVELHPFGEKDWQRFAVLLSVPFSRLHYWVTGREDEDRALLDDFQTLCIQK